MPSCDLQSPKPLYQYLDTFLAELTQAGVKLGIGLQTQRGRGQRPNHLQGSRPETVMVGGTRFLIRPESVPQEIGKGKRKFPGGKKAAKSIRRALKGKIKKLMNANLGEDLVAGIDRTKIVAMTSKKKFTLSLDPLGVGEAEKIKKK